MDGHCHITVVVSMLEIKKSINVEGKRRFEEDGWTFPYHWCGENVGNEEHQCGGKRRRCEEDGHAPPPKK